MPPAPADGAPAAPALSVEVTAAHPLSADALAMIAGSEAELASIYPPEVRFAFSPQQLVDGGVAFFVARAGGRAVGCGGLAPCEGYGELKRIYTDPAMRGRGVARAVIAALEDEARRRGLTVVRLETGGDSPAALGLYRRLGYVDRGPFGAYRENGSSLFMEKRLEGAA